MKTLITTLAIGFTLLTAKANHSSVFKLKMFDNGTFSVVLDERPSGSQSSRFSATHIKPGYHRLKVIRYYHSPYSYYPIKKVVYMGMVNIPPASVVYASITCHNELDVVKIEPKYCHPTCGHGHGNGHGHGHGNGHGNGHGWDDDYEENGWETPAPPLPMCMATADFMLLKSSMAGKPFDSRRFEIARQALGYSYFTSAQIAELIRLFSFESSRLEFAKRAFEKTIDKQNYFLVSDAFTFSSSIGALNEYIAMGK